MSESDGLTIHVNGKTYPIDPDDLEVWEVEFIEEFCDGPMHELDFTRMRTLRALTWIMLRRDNEALTIEDVGRMKMGAFGEPEADPTPAPKKAPAKKSAAQS